MPEAVAKEKPRQDTQRLPHHVTKPLSKSSTGRNQVHDPGPRRRHFALNAALKISSQAEIQDRGNKFFSLKEPKLP